MLKGEVGRALEGKPVEESDGPGSCWVPRAPFPGLQVAVPSCGGSHCVTANLLGGFLC